MAGLNMAERGCPMVKTFSEDEPRYLRASDEDDILHAEEGAEQEEDAAEHEEEESAE